jgi:PDZ domain-containing protein
MSRRALTLASAGFLVVLLSAVAALLPVPYVVLSPGPTANTLGTVDKTALITIDGHRTYDDKGSLDLTTVSVLGGPRQRMDLVTALRGWLDGNAAVVPEGQVYPDDETAEQVEQRSNLEMQESQENATTSALRLLGIPVTTRVLVDGFSPGSPSKGKLQKGDELVAVDGKPAMGGARLRELITAHEPGDKVALTVKRDGKEVQTTVKTVKASPEDSRAIIGVTTRDDADYPFKVQIKLDDVGGPSAGLMFALGIVDKLTPGSMTGGAHVAGTGTIDDQGHVGTIGGIAQKMAGAKRSGATAFLAPAGNCPDTAGVVPDGLRLVKVETLSSAVNALDDLRAGRPVPTC